MTNPNPVEIKSLLSEVLSERNHKQIALELGIHQSDVSRRFSPHCPRKNGIAEGLRELRAISKVDPVAFQTLKAYFEVLLETWAKPDAADPAPTLVCEVDKEAGDVIRAFVQGKPEHDQDREAAEAIAAIRRFMARPRRKQNEVSLPRKEQRLRRTG